MKAAAIRGATRRLKLAQLAAKRKLCRPKPVLKSFAHVRAIVSLRLQLRVVS